MDRSVQGGFRQTAATSGAWDSGAARVKKWVGQTTGLVPDELPELITRFALPPLVPAHMLCATDDRPPTRSRKLNELLAIDEVDRPLLYLCGPRDGQAGVTPFQYAEPVQLSCRQGDHVTLIVNLKDPPWAEFFGVQARAGLRELRVPIDCCQLQIVRPAGLTFPQLVAWRQLAATFEAIDALAHAPPPPPAGEQRCCIVS